MVVTTAALTSDLIVAGGCFTVSWVMGCGGGSGGDDGGMLVDEEDVCRSVPLHQPGGTTELVPDVHSMFN